MVYLPLQIFLTLFFDDHGRCEYLAMKIGFVVDVSLGDKGMTTKAHGVGTPEVCSGRIP
jgi:hypothetical protein